MRFIASFIAVTYLMGCSKKENLHSKNSGQNSSTEPTTSLATADVTTTVAPDDAIGTISANEKTITVAPAVVTSTVAAVEETTTVAAAEETTTVAPATEETTTVAPATEETTTVAAVAMPTLSGGESGYVARCLHTTTTTPTTMPGDAILAATTTRVSFFELMGYRRRASPRPMFPGEDPQGYRYLRWYD